MGHWMGEKRDLTKIVSNEMSFGEICGSNEKVEEYY